MVDELLPVVWELGLARRVDIFIEDAAFTPDEARFYLYEAQKMGFETVVHGDQFTRGGSQFAAEHQAVSVDHLEALDTHDIETLARSEVVAVVLPGASLGLGLPFAPARKILDAGCCLAISSDWNPGTAPMGDLLLQATLLGTYEKLSIAELFSGMTIRAARALRLTDRGILKEGFLADICAYPTDDYREIVYRQGKLKPVKVWKRGIECVEETLDT